MSLVDFNRSGAPLMEIVTEPDIRTAEQARRYAEELQLLLRTIGASDADMERGQMRVEANVSLRPRGTEAFGTRVEVKNMNSFRSVERAIDYEIERQAAALDAGEPLRPGDARLVRRPRRDVPDAVEGDVRRLPLLPGAGPAAAPRGPGLAGRAAGRLPELPAARRARYRDVARAERRTTRRCLLADPDATALFEATLAADRRGAPPSRSRTGSPGSTCGCATRRPEAVRGRAGRARGDHPGGRRRRRSRAPTAGGLRGARRRRARPRPRSSRRAASARSPTPARSAAAVDEVLAANPAAVADYRAGKEQAIGFLVGQVMKATRGQANAALVQAAVRERLDASG